MFTPRPWKALSFLAASALIVSGCSASAAPAASAPTPSVTATIGCVTDPAAVVARPLDAPATPLPDALVQQLRATTEASRAQISAPGAIVAIQTPEGRWVEAFGLADPATGREMTVADAQRVGSITKTFTGTLILQLVEDGEISLDDPISEYVDSVPNGENITLRMLVTMVSGLASYTLEDTFQQDWFNNPQKEWTAQQLLDDAFALPPLFPPGAEFNYSNTNFVLLGEVIEKVTDRTYEEEFDERIFEPLGLSSTFVPPSTDLPDPHSIGFTMQSTASNATEPVNATNWSPSFARTAGVLVSTTEDLLVWGRALATGNGILDTQTQIERLTFPAKGGYGQAVGCINGWVGHTGELPGYNTSVFYDTGNDITIITLTNSDIPSGECTTSQTLPSNPSTGDCMAPATHLFVDLSKTLGNEFIPNPMS